MYADAVDLCGYCCESEGAPVVCRDFAPELDMEVVNCSSDLVDWFELLCAIGGDDVSSLCVRPVLCDRVISQPVLSGTSSRKFALGFRPGVHAGSLCRFCDTICVICIVCSRCSV